MGTKLPPPRPPNGKISPPTRVRLTEHFTSKISQLTRGVPLAHLKVNIMCTKFADDQGWGVVANSPTTPGGQ